MLKVVRNDGAGPALDLSLLEGEGLQWMAEMARAREVKLQSWDEDGLNAELSTFGLPLEEAGEPRDYQMSRFALARREEGNWLLESGRGRGVVRLLRPPWIVHLRRPAALHSGFFRLLVAAGVLVRSGQEEADPELMAWEFHDLYFHSRSRFGRHALVPGFSGRNVGRLDPPPGVRPAPEGEVVALPVPAAPHPDPPFSQVMEGRVSHRVYGEPPLTLEQLGEFLYRVGRVRGRSQVELAGVPFELSHRPYPCGGAAYELEIYPFVARCQGLERGTYFYDAGEHRLIRLPGSPDKVLATEVSQIKLVYSARFLRMNWKYDTVAYSLILKDVGVLMQSMYLVATAMGLAGCAVGTGDGDDFCEATGNRYFVEGSVGEFCLGSVPKP